MLDVSKRNLVVAVAIIAISTWLTRGIEAVEIGGSDSNDPSILLDASSSDQFESSITFNATMESISSKTESEKKCDVDQLHRYAWPDARKYYNSKIANEKKQIRKLNKDAFLRPSRVQERDQSCVLIYGGNKAGLYILVEITREGEILSISGGYASK